jgi:uncharacterized protein YutE (UPF0331/DUF86 family)
MESAKLNITRLINKIEDIKGSLDVLERYAQQDDNTFLSNEEAICSARYSFIVLIEAATNIAAHICARILNKAPNTYAESFLLLSEKMLIEQTLAERLGKMVGFRNLLIHGYGKIDDMQMLNIMRNNLGDVRQYLDAIKTIIEEHTGGEC